MSNTMNIGKQHQQDFCTLYLSVRKPFNFFLGKASCNYFFPEKSFVVYVFYERQLQVYGLNL